MTVIATVGVIISGLAVARLFGLSDSGLLSPGLLRELVGGGVLCSTVCIGLLTWLMKGTRLK